VPYNEQETRFFLIDRVLWDKGYNTHQRIKMETPAPVEPSGHKGRRRKGAGRVDYLPCVQLPHKAYWQPAEIPWVKTGEVAFAPITATEEAISTKALAECSLALLPAKTILVAMYGQAKTRGQSAMLEIAAATNQACFAILPNDTWEPAFLHYWLMASYQDLRDLSEDRGGNQANLNGALLKALQAPAPDHAVQKDIVQRVKAALATIDTMEQACKASLKDIEQLPQRILAQAFEQVAA